MSASRGAAAVAAELGLDRRYDAWLDQLKGPVLPPGPVAPDGAAQALEPGRVRRLLARLGCSPSAVADVLATLPDARRAPARWWLVQASRARLCATMGEVETDIGRWPQLPAELGLEGRCFPLHLFAATVPAVRAWHRAHGVADDLSWATLADLGRHQAAYFNMTGSTGVDAPWWMTLHLRSVLYQLGSLQYVPCRLGTGPEQPQPWYDEAEAEARGEGFRPGDLALGMHIPDGADLSPEACAASLRLARHFFARLLPGRGRRLVTCSTWLLDDQLCAYLLPESNIARFQAMFDLVPGWGPADDAVLGFVFAKRGVAPEPGPGLTRLQQAVLEHLGAGGHFRWRTGWCDLPQAEG